MGKERKPISDEAYEKPAQYYFEFVDTKPYNADYERPGLHALLPEVKGNGCWTRAARQAGTRPGCWSMARRLRR